VIYDVDEDRGILYAGQSNGSNDGQGHYGPKVTDRTWEGEKSSNGARYLQLGKGDRLIIVRPPAAFG
jgi:hypothetical protein